MRKDERRYEIYFTSGAVFRKLVGSDKGAESRMGYFMSGYGRVDGWKRALL